MEITAGILSVGAVSVELPMIVADTTVQVWQVPADYRENGLFVAVKVPGQAPEFPACTLQPGAYLGEIEYVASLAQQVEGAKRARLAALAELCDEALDALVVGYPSGEVKSWPQQVREAQAVMLDATAAAPLLESIAARRELPLATLVERVLAKSVLYAQASGDPIGRRQAAEDLLDLAETLEDVAAVTW